MEKLFFAITSIMVVGVIVSFLGCSNSNDKYESNSFVNFNNAQRLLDNPSKENLKTAESHLQKVDTRSVLYKDAQRLLERIPTKLKDLENNNNENKPVKFTKDQLTDTFSRRWLTRYSTATDISFIGKNKQIMKVMVSFQHDQAEKVIHDGALIGAAKSAGIKRIEFHDWSGLTKEYLSHDIN